MVVRLMQSVMTRKMVRCSFILTIKRRHHFGPNGISYMAGMDEIILPVDWESNGYIDDNYMHAIM